jgi:phospholipid/cholesterol/gamma-HCH transport system substrate-binding protein
MNTESKVGLFFIISLIVIAGMIMKTSQFDLFQKGKFYSLTAVLETAQGLDKDTDVRMAGVKIGKVKEIVLENGKAKVVMEIFDNVKLPAGSRIKVVAKGILGDKYVEVYPSQYKGQYLKSGDLLNSEKAVTMDDIMDIVFSVAKDVKKITTSLSNTVGTNKGEEQIANILENIDRITSDLRAITERNKDNFSNSIDNIQSFTADLKREIPILSEKLDKLATNLNTLVDNNSDNITETITNAKESSKKLNETLDYIEDISKKISTGEGTIGKLVNDEETHTNLNDTLVSIKNAADGATDFLNTFKDTGLYLGFRTEYMFDINQNKSYFSVDILPEGGRAYKIELIDDPFGKTKNYEYHHVITNPDGSIRDEYTENITKTQDSFTYNALIGQRFGDFLVEIGLIESKGGFGINYKTKSKNPISLSLQAFDFSRENDLNAHLKFSASYKFYNDFYVIGGYDDFLEKERSQFFLGVGIRFRDDYFKHLLSAVSMK